MIRFNYFSLRDFSDFVHKLAKKEFYPKESTSPLRIMSQRIKAVKLILAWLISRSQALVIIQCSPILAVSFFCTTRAWHSKVCQKWKAEACQFLIFCQSTEFGKRGLIFYNWVRYSLPKLQYHRKKLRLTYQSLPKYLSFFKYYQSLSNYLNSHKL